MSTRFEPCRIDNQTYYRGMTSDPPRVMLVTNDVFEMNRTEFPPEELYNPDEWLPSVDGESCFLATCDYCDVRLATSIRKDKTSKKTKHVCAHSPCLSHGTPIRYTPFIVKQPESEPEQASLF